MELTFAGTDKSLAETLGRMRGRVNTNSVSKPSMVNQPPEPVPANSPPDFNFN